MKTIELVLIGHPDKVCDGIAEAIKKQNPDGRNAIEVCWFNNKIIVGGETDKVWHCEDIHSTVRDYLLDVVGLISEECDAIEIVNCLNTQSSEINAIVGAGGTGDNGIFFGGWHKVYSPMIFKLKKLCAKLDAVTLAKLGYRTDGKFVADINEDGTISRLVLNIASFKGLMPGARELESLIYTTAKNMGVEILDNIQINPKGNWNKCFGFADAGLTGRKLACDTQCGLFHNGGGSWFGKDTSKADFTIPIVLILHAKFLCEVYERNSTELFASTIIGDTKVRISDLNNTDYVDDFDYSYLMDYVKEIKVDIFGCFEMEGGANEL